MKSLLNSNYNEKFLNQRNLQVITQHNQREQTASRSHQKRKVVISVMTNAGPLHMIPVSGLVQQLGLIYFSIHIGSFSPVTKMKSDNKTNQALNLAIKPEENFSLLLLVEMSKGISFCLQEE